jgi:hypothetical protein
MAAESGEELKDGDEQTVTCQFSSAALAWDLASYLTRELICHLMYMRGHMPWCVSACVRACVRAGGRASACASVLSHSTPTQPLRRSSRRGNRVCVQASG